VRKHLIIGTRSSKLALWQAEHIAGRLRQQHPQMTVSLRHIMTTGDKILDVPLAKVGGKGLFTKELEVAMLAGEIDLAVHSLKDMPTELPPGLILAAVTERADAGDALVSPRYRTLAALPQGAKVGTSSLRRKAQLLRARPDLTIVDLRGNLDTRLRKLEMEGLDAIVLAVAGLKRLGWGARITEILDPAVCLPAVGQGALALEARAADQEVLELLAFLDHPATKQAVAAERAFLHAVEGGCQIPVAVYGELQEQKLALEAAILSLDGQRVVRRKVLGDPAAAAGLGEDLAQAMLQAGGQALLEEVRERLV